MTHPARSANPIRPGLPNRQPHTEPFTSVEQAWFWTMSALAARRDGTGRGSSGTSRPCDPDDIIKCLDGLYRQRRIDLLHARVLRTWGERQSAPDPRYPLERSEARIWREAMDRLEWPLRVKGILA